MEIGPNSVEFFTKAFIHWMPPLCSATTLRLLNALNSEDRGLKVRFSLATIVFETFELILCQMLSSQGKNQTSYPAEVRKWIFSPFFSAKGVVKFGVKFWWNFPSYVFQALGVRRKISPKFHIKNGVKNGKFHANFTLLGRNAEEKRTLKPLSSLFSAFSNLKESVFFTDFCSPSRTSAPVNYFLQLQ